MWASQNFFKFIEAGLELIKPCRVEFGNHRFNNFGEGYSYKPDTADHNYLA